MSAPQMPADRSVELRQIELDAAEQQRQRQEAADAQRRTQLQQLRGDARTSGRGSAENYFRQQGLDPTEYSGSIDSQINQILAGIAPDDPNPGGYFNNVGETVYGNERTGARTRANRELDRIFSPNFAESRIPTTLDDSILAGIEGEQYAGADEIIRNMLDRGVITPTGYSAAEKNLQGQRPGVKARLDEVGMGQLASGQGKLRDVANRARSTAGQLELGQQFDPFSFGGEADSAFTDFISKLGGNIRAAAPGNLFNTAGLGAIAGAGSGAQNTKFDPNALAGIIAGQEEKTLPRTNTSSVF